MLTATRKLQAVRTVHTLAWAVFASAIVLIPVAVARGSLRVAWILIAVVAVECLILVLNRMRCPLTPLAARYTEDRSDNFDIYLPLWLARYNKEVFGTLYVAGLIYAALTWIRR
jgi:hypothetical protein